MPKKMTPYDEGYEAFLEGRPLSSCPYKEGSDEQLQWTVGWGTAQTDVMGGRNAK